MKKSQIRCTIGSSLVLLASILILCFYVLNLVEGAGRNQIYSGISNLSKATGPNIAFYIVANAFYILTLVLSIVTLILSVIGLFGGIFDIKGLNMTLANRTLCVINMLSALAGLAFMIVYVAAQRLPNITVGVGPITVFISSVLALVGAFVAQTRKIYKNN